MITFIIPSIRITKLRPMYDSIKRSYSGKFKVIIISPYPQTEDMTLDNVKWIMDKGNPVRCHQLAIEYVDTPLVTWMADDGLYVNGRLDECVAACQEPNDVITLKYLEGSNPNGDMTLDDYYYFMYHKDLRDLAGIPDGCHIISFAIMHTSLLKAVGGFNCIYESIAMAHCDLAIRLKKYGAQFFISPEVIIVLEHQPNLEGDHAPIHNSQTEHDKPAFDAIWREPNDLVTVQLDAWKEVGDVWGRRFGK